MEFAVEDGIPYAIDYMNPAPDADVNSVGKANFDWIVNNVAELAVRKAKEHTGKPAEYRWSAFLNGGFANQEKSAAASSEKSAAKDSGSAASKPLRKRAGKG